MQIRFSVLITKEANLYVAKCVENSVASQGPTIEEAKANLKEALELYYEDEPCEDYTSFGETLLTSLEVTLP
jgi:predicted RNase H-like HicB family nuclease